MIEGLMLPKAFWNAELDTIKLDQSRPTSTVRWPDFFIIGAPKCGTTALSAYLAAHPNVCFSHIKEPHYFSTDFPRRQNVSDREEYLSLFSNTSSDVLLGEGSVWYLYSEVAVKNILRVQPKAKFIIMLRNPVDAAYSLHNQKLMSAEEDVRDFLTAWNLQKDRKDGRFLPKHCYEPAMLFYRDVYCFGKQVQRLLSHVSPEQLHFIFYDNFSAETKKTYSELLRFLGLPPVVPNEFPVINKNQAYRSSYLNRIIQKPSRLRSHVSKFLRRTLGIRSFGFRRIFNSLNRSDTKRTPLPQEVRKELARSFKDDIALLENLIKRDLSTWTN